MEPRRLATLGLSFTSLVAASCQAGAEDECGDEAGASQPGPPTLVSARFVDERVIELSFSEPLAPVDDVDPSAFRISWTWSASGGAYYEAYTAYYDPMLALCLSTDYCEEESTSVVGVRCSPGDPSSLLLTLDRFSPLACQLINDFQSYDPGYASPLLPHFDAEIATITDLDGEALASIGPDFVTTDDVYLEVSGEFPNYPMPIPIDCAAEP